MAQVETIKRKSEEDRVYTKSEVIDFLSEIETRLIEHHVPSFHTLLALNSILRLRNAREIFDEDLKTRARDLWIKVKSANLHLMDPPLLFGDGVKPPPELAEDLDEGYDGQTNA